MNIGLPPQMKSYRNYLVEIVLLVVVIGLFGWFMVLPKRADVEQVAGQRDKLSDQQKGIHAKAEDLNRLVKELNSNSGKVAELDQALPLSGNLSNLQILLESLANNSGVIVGDISVSGKGDSVVAGDKALISDPFGATRTLQIFSGSVFVMGSFAQLQNFLQGLEQSARIIEVTSLDLAPVQKDQLGMKLNIQAFYLSPY